MLAKFQIFFPLENYFFIIRVTCSDDSPRNSAGLQHVCDAHIPRPDVKLPLLQAKHATQDGARVDSYPHVHVEIKLLLYIPEFVFLRWTKSLHTQFKEAKYTFHCRQTYRLTDRIVLIMARPISTQCWAWARCGSGTPDTQ